MKIDRPFLDKFNTTTFLANKNELLVSIKQEISNVLSTRLKLKGNIDDLPNIKFNPYAYGIRDIQSFEEISSWRDILVEHYKRYILQCETRIKDCSITNISINREQQSISFSLLFTLHQSQDVLQTSIKVVY